jgi:hypothetical protein
MTPKGTVNDKIVVPDDLSTDTAGILREKGKRWRRYLSIVSLLFICLRAITAICT